MSPARARAASLYQAWARSWAQFLGCETAADRRLWVSLLLTAAYLGGWIVWRVTG